MPELSIILPSFNEEQHLPETLEKLHDVVTQTSLDVETIVLDDESQDKTLEVATDLAARYPALHVRVFHHVRQRVGFGAVARFGIAHARGRYCCFVSADGVDPVELIPEFVKRLRAGAHQVQCSRYIRAADARSVPRKYRIYQSVYRRLVRWLLGREITDSTYAFRAFDRVYVQALGLTSNRFSLCPEITFKIVLSGGVSELIPGQPAPYDAGGSNKFKLSNETLGYAYVLLRAWMHQRKLYWF
ncbi:MAG: glycosyltransferase family 2 protein [Acidobacteria bacterium]|nr:MAG: glycosyltransferase family 2 protein [Acidobacteriota bacterium]